MLPQRVGRADVLRLKILNKVFHINPLNGGTVGGRQQLPAPPVDDNTADVLAVGDNNVQTSDANKSSDGEMEIEIISNLQEMDLFRHLECIIKEVHLLWELVITNEPIIVIGNSPSISSHVVQSLVRWVFVFFLHSYCV